MGWVCVFCWHPKMMKYMHEEENPSFLSSISWQPPLFTHISYWLWVVTCQQHSQSFSKCKTQQSQEYFFGGKSKEIVSFSGKHPQSRNFIIFPHLRNFRPQSISMHATFKFPCKSFFDDFHSLNWQKRLGLSLVLPFNICCIVSLCG